MINEPNKVGDGHVERISYGNPIVGIWICTECRYKCFPRHLREIEAQPPFKCPECGNNLKYDEEE